MRKFIPYIIVVLSLCHAMAAKAQNTTSGTSKLLEDEIELLKSDADLKHAAWSILAMETATGTILAEYNADMGLEPASVLKILTTGAAISLLGSDFTFTTKLEYSGTIDSNGTLHGNLYIKGGGDPTIGSKRFGKEVSTDSIFSDFYNALRKYKIRHIAGKIIADATIYEDNPLAYSWSWEDIGNYYASGTWGLNCNENLYRLYFDAGATVSSPAILSSMEPNMSDITFTNHVITGKSGSGDNVVIFGAPYSNERLLEGTVPLGKKHFDVDGSLPDPPSIMAVSFLQFIQQKGILVDSSSTSMREMIWQGKSDTNARQTLAFYISPKLSDIIFHTNMKSVNLFAEAILKMIGYTKSQVGSSGVGIEAIKNFYINKGIDLDGFDMEDGCGLSRKNKISTRQLAEILCMLRKEKDFAAFEKSLPVAGKSGGMASLLTGTVAENNMKAKTGNMEKIKSYAGYVKNAAQKDVAFAIIVNNYTCSNATLRPKLEKLMLLIAQTK